MAKQINLLQEPAEVRFQNFDRDNPHVYTLFKQFATQLFKKGHKRIGGRMIIERIRWETMIETTDQDYKINNNYISHYTRKYIRDFPEHRDKFNTRVLKAY